MKKNIKQGIAAFSGVGFIYSLIKGIITFYKGYHNLDLSANFLNLGYSLDTNTAGQMVNLKDYYLIGLNQMQGGLGWVCLAIVFCFVFAFFVSFERR